MSLGCTQSSAGNTTLDRQLCPGKFSKKRSTGDSAQLSDKMANAIIDECKDVAVDYIQKI